MTTQITPFDFHGHNVRVLTDEHDEPWFIAKDVCAVLGLDNVTNALRALDDDEKSNFTNCNVAQIVCATTARMPRFRATARPMGSQTVMPQEAS